jgi:hypothetical protein
MASLACEAHHVPDDDSFSLTYDVPRLDFRPPHWLCLAAHEIPAFGRGAPATAPGELSLAVRDGYIHGLDPAAKTTRELYILYHGIIKWMHCRHE